MKPPHWPTYSEKARGYQRLPEKATEKSPAADDDSMGNIARPWCGFGSLLPRIALSHSLSAVKEAPWRAWHSRHKKDGIDRDFNLYKTIIDIPQAPDDLWAVSDIHGDYDRFLTLASANNLVRKNGNDVHWSGGSATLVVCGDMINKGAKNLESLELIKLLQEEAPKSGGKVIVLLGNHEVQFLANPFNDKSEGPGGIWFDLKEWGIKPKVFASDKHPMGFWMRRLPLGARVGDFFFAHGGQTSGRSLLGLGKMLEVALKSHGFHDVLIGGPNSLPRGRNWWGGDDAAKGRENARLLGVRFIVHGHDPDTLYPRGEVILFPEKNPCLIRIDTGMTSIIDYSHGQMLHVQSTEKGNLCEARDHKGRAKPLGLFPRLPEPPGIHPAKSPTNHVS